jgi:nicotinate phosphoribosyltransferase
MNERFSHTISSDLDYYKYTMGDVIHETHPDDEVTFTMKNRNLARPLAEYVTPELLGARLDAIRERGFDTEEITYLAGLQAQNGEARFTAAYLDRLADMKLPPANVMLHPETHDLAVTSTGAWADVSIWETVVMSEINELYYEQYLQKNGLHVDALYQEGDARLDEKIAKLHEHPDIRFADFGTRRRFSRAWHEHVVERLANELPNQFVGTSNPWFAYKYNLAPIGTFAHEMPMVYAGLADKRDGTPLVGHGEMLRDWERHYQGDLSIALTDTFGSDYFFSDYTPEQAHEWRGLRHDSGDPIDFGEKAIDFYLKHEIDPTEKTIVFSDGLDVDEIIRLSTHFAGRINLLFGWGTNLMNDLGIPANNFVMKATAVNDTPTVKLSDDAGKHTGPEDYVERYQEAAQVHHYATA